MFKLTRHPGNPILSPNDKNQWEERVVANPAAWYDQDRGEVILLYRAAGDDEKHLIHLGMATSRDGFNFTRASDSPLVSPIEGNFDGGCIEDPRIIKVDGWYLITYASRMFPPGRYWEVDPTVKRREFPDAFPAAMRTNLTSTNLLVTKDFKSFIRAGRLTDANVDDRDVILFPERINGKWWLLHRPMAWTGPKYGTDFPAMWICAVDDLLDSKHDKMKLLAKAKFPWEKKIGGSTPPLKTPHGWLTLYHGVGADKYYRIGALMLDLDDPSKVTHRTPDFIFEPEADYETKGYYNGCVFPCGNLVIGDTFFMYYGAADKYLGVATCNYQSLIDHLLSCPDQPA